MQMYGKRAVRKRIQKEVLHKRETREAVVFDVDYTNRYCRVKVTGNDTPIVARFPQNWEKTPVYLKPGNPVMIRHIAGNVHRIDVAGHGKVIPTGITAATIAAGEDTVLSGCLVKPIPNERMAVYVQPGTIRIAGDEYTVGTIKMGAGSGLKMGDGIPMGACSAIKVVTAASSTQYRIDALVVGTDGVVDYVVGTPSSTSPELPAVPANHVLVGWVFVPPNTTAITADLINMGYVDPFAASLDISVADDELAGGSSPEMTTTITVTVKDQYGNNITGTKWGITASFLSGDGLIDGVETKTRYTSASSSSVTFTYGRTGDSQEQSPMLQFSLVQEPEVIGVTFIKLLDDAGDVML